MQDKITLEELAPYLPYELKMSKMSNPLETDFILSGLIYDGAHSYCEIDNSGFFYGYSKPLVHPLSQLTQNDIERLAPMYNPNDIDTFIEDIRSGFIFHSVIVALIKEHWDIYSWIERGLALPITS